MSRDTLGESSYSALMAGQAHIIVTIDTKDPVELGDFVAAFTSLSSQYHQYIAENHPSLRSEAKIFITEIRPGSIIADLIPFAKIFGLTTVVPIMEQIDIVVDFVDKYGAKIVSLFTKDQADMITTKESDLNDFFGAVSAIAKDKDGSAAIEAAYFEDGKREVKAAFRFTTTDARTAIETIARERVRLEGKLHETKQRVLMTFTQTNVKTARVDKRTSERVVIEEISPTDRPLVYASELAEQQIKHEITEADENVFKKGFMVDVSIMRKDDKIAAYKVINVHQVIDLTD